MNLLDALPIVLVVAYVALGFFSGVVRRLVGIIGVYISFLAATNMGLQAGQILQQSSSLETPDARIYGFFGIVVIVIVVVEGAAQLAHGAIQIEAIVLNRVLGVLVGLITAVLLSVVITYELQGAGNPFGGGALDVLQLRIRDSVRSSHVAVPLVKSVGKPIITIFQPVLPNDSQIYFSSGLVG
ncbi:MAG TPA: CvpA family protein [Candidatus Dormibacteraeota bacterium]|nr:CvpA family protein [Candidatus Dormibacteraeota bacterium]